MEFTYDHFLRRFIIRMFTEVQLRAMVETLIFNKHIARFQMFGAPSNRPTLHALSYGLQPTLHTTRIALQHKCCHRQRRQGVSCGL